MNSVDKEQTMDSPREIGITHCGALKMEWGKRTYVMGIINVTPDSFSGDGLEYDVETALEQALRFQGEGADIIDVGGESTRPGSTPVDADEEKRRVIPVIRLLASKLDIPISVDTYKHTVAQEALSAGASMINDIWGLQHDPSLATLAAREGVPIVLMHNQLSTNYTDLVPDVMASLRASLNRALEAGVPTENVLLDPGLGFGKRPEDNLEILRRLEEFTALGRPLLVGMSRKSTIGMVLDLPVEERLEGTAATVALVIAKGADMVRVHDVEAMTRIARMSDAIVRGWQSSTLYP
jgi:dihydropteroate synthase